MSQPPGTQPDSSQDADAGLGFVQTTGDNSIGSGSPFPGARALHPWPWPSPQPPPAASRGSFRPVARAGTSRKASYKGTIGPREPEPSGHTCSWFQEQSRPCLSNKIPLWCQQRPLESSLRRRSPEQAGQSRQWHSALERPLAGTHQGVSRWC